MKIELKHLPMNLGIISDLSFVKNEICLSRFDYSDEEDFFYDVESIEKSIEKFPQIEKYIEIKDDEVVIKKELLNELVF